MKHNIFYSITALAFALAHSQAATVIFDDFDSGGNGLSITGRTPVFSNTANPYVQAGAEQPIKTTFDYGNPATGGYGEYNAGSAIELNGAGFTSLSTDSITLSLQIGFSGLTGTAAEGRGIGLGFYSGVVGNEYGNNRFTGFLIDSTGSLSYARDPNQLGFYSGPGAIKGPSIAYVGTYQNNNSNFKTLSYTINRATGAVTAISLSGSTATYDDFIGLTGFTEAATKYVGINTSAPNFNIFGTFDNFQVDVVPEPSAALLSGLGVLALLRRRRH